MNPHGASADPAASARLAILTPRWGAPSETFIRRHLLEILPGRTVAVTRSVQNPDWCREVPMWSVHELTDSPVAQFARLFGGWRYDARARALRNFLERHQVNTVLGEWLNFSAIWFQSVRDMGLKFFAHAHGYDVSRKGLKRPWYRFLYRRLRHMDGVITFSQTCKERLLNALTIDPNQIHVIPYGVNVPPELPPRQESEDIICLHVGRMVEKKGPLITLKAFHAAHRECGRLRLEMVGDGPLLAGARSFCREHGLEGVVTFHGSKPHDFVKSRLARADMFLLHSVTARDGNEEGLPVAILEGLSYGLPVISTRHSGIPEAVREGQNGFLVEEHDDQTMAARIVELANQPALRGRMGETGRRMAIQTFSAEEEIRRLRELMFGEVQPLKR